MKKLYTILILFVSLFVVSCGEKGPQGYQLGKVEVFKSSIFKKYEPVIVTKRISFAFNEDAQEFLKGEEFRFVVVDKIDGKEIPSNVNIYKDGKLLEGNSFTVQVAENVDFELGVEFKPDAEEAVHRLYLVLDKRCGSTQYPLTIDEQSEIYHEGMRIEKVNVANPGNVVVTWILIAIVALILFWYLFLRPTFFRHLHFSRVEITYPGAEPITIKTSGCCSLVLTNKPVKQNFKKLLCIADAVEVNEVWECSRTVITSRNKHDLRVKGYVDYTPDMPQKDEEFTITTDSGAKVKIYVY